MEEKAVLNRTQWFTEHETKEQCSGSAPPQEGNVPPIQPFGTVQSSQPEEEPLDRSRSPQSGAQTDLQRIHSRATEKSDPTSTDATVSNCFRGRAAIPTAEPLTSEPPMEKSNPIPTAEPDADPVRSSMPAGTPSETTAEATAVLHLRGDEPAAPETVSEQADWEFADSEWWQSDANANDWQLYGPLGQAKFKRHANHQARGISFHISSDGHILQRHANHQATFRIIRGFHHIRSTIARPCLFKHIANLFPKLHHWHM